MLRDGSSAVKDKVLPVENIRKTRPTDLTRGPFAAAKRLIDAFSTTDQKRPPPLATKSQHIRLISIGPSNFCEKARWALDLLDEDALDPRYYTEDCHPPAFAAFATVPASHGEWSASPMIIFDDPKPTDKSVIFDSTEILQNLCPNLYPSEDILQFELYLGEMLGATSRCLVYHHLLRPEYFPLLSKIATAHSSKIESVLFERMLPNGLAKGMRKTMNINEETADASIAAIRDVFDQVSTKLDNGKRQYLFESPGDNVSFTAADLTFASLAAPLILPPELREFYPEYSSQLPPVLGNLRQELCSTAAGKHALAMYRYHRFSIERKENVMGRIISAKIMGRNRVPWPVGLFAGCAVAAIAYGADKLRRSKL